MKHGQFLELQACPYCGMANPNLTALSPLYPTTSHDNKNHRYWAIYTCKSCGGVVLAEAPAVEQRFGDLISAQTFPGEIHSIFPEPRKIADEIPSRPKHYLDEAIRALSTPTGALMLCASAVDAMLKERGLADGSLYTRIDTAEKDHVITADMAKWAHHVRLEANGQRHADEDEPLPTKDDAERSLEFALALAEFLFVLPARVTRGLNAATPKS